MSVSFFRILARLEILFTSVETMDSIVRWMFLALLLSRSSNTAWKTDLLM